MPRPSVAAIADGQPNTALPVNSAFNYLFGTGSDAEIAFAKPHNFDSETVAVASGAITASKGFVAVTGEGGADDNLDTINEPTGGFEVGTVIVVMGGAAVQTNGTLAHTVTVRDQGNIVLANVTRIALDRPTKSITLRKLGTKWYEVARSGGVDLLATIITPPQIVDVLPVQLSAVAYSLSGGTLTYAWAATLGTFSSTTVQNPMWYPPSVSTTQRTATLTLTVTDSAGQTATATVAFTVRGISSSLSIALSAPSTYTANSQMLWQDSQIANTPTLASPYFVAPAGRVNLIEFLGRLNTNSGNFQFRVAGTDPMWSPRFVSRGYFVFTIANQVLAFKYPDVEPLSETDLNGSFSLAAYDRVNAWFAAIATATGSDNSLRTGTMQLVLP